MSLKKQQISMFPCAITKGALESSETSLMIYSIHWNIVTVVFGELSGEVESCNSGQKHVQI